MYSLGSWTTAVTVVSYMEFVVNDSRPIPHPHAMKLWCHTLLQIDLMLTPGSHNTEEEGKFVYILQWMSN